MAAFAALTSLKHIIDNLQNHPSPPICIDKQQVRSLTEIVTFLQEFLQGYNSEYADSEEADPLEIRIADAAYAAEDVIESKIVDRIHNQSTAPLETGDDFYQELQLVIEEMDQIKKVTMTNTTVGSHLLRRNFSTNVGSSTSFSTAKASTMVGFDDVFFEVLDRLTGNQLDLQIIPITGMGGIGKTTLARNLFEAACIKEHFDVRAWTTISQNFDGVEMFKELLSQTKGNSSGVRENQLGLELYQYLMRRRYLIVMDDMWSIEVWDNIKCYFPSCNDGSRVIITTRLSNLASHLNNGFNMKFLDEASSWTLFSKSVFGEESFPLELVKIGKKIIRKCKGLPLLIVTVGGLLAKSEQTQECWEHIKDNFSSIVNSEDQEYCLRILKMSYNYLPVHLKPCFLYMGVFGEDQEIRVSTLIKLWVSEGFLVPSSEKTLEAIARENLKGLADRNLVIVHELGYNGNIKYCKIHDLLRDLCLREAKKERFYHHVVGGHIPDGVNRWRRISIQRSTSNEIGIEALQSMPHARSVICNANNLREKDIMPHSFRLLRTLKAYDRELGGMFSYDLKYVFQLVNLRYLTVEASRVRSMSPTSLNFLWNLHIIIIDTFNYFKAPIGFWNMPYLRHVQFSNILLLPNPPSDNVVVMENLQTLERVMNFELSQEVVKRIPNIKKLTIKYGRIHSKVDYCLNNLACLHKLESFQCFIESVRVHDSVKKLTFPQSLKKLGLFLEEDFELEEILETIGFLPLLQKLKLYGGFFATREWETTEGQFRKLEFLELRACGSLERWTSESSHFPLLKEIHLFLLSELKEIPSEIGDIPTLRAIVLDTCGKLVVMSAKRIVEEQKELLGEDPAFHVRVVSGYNRNTKL